jgi:hypothetical protein
MLTSPRLQKYVAAVLFVFADADALDAMVSSVPPGDGDAERLTTGISSRGLNTRIYRSVGSCSRESVIVRRIVYAPAIAYVARRSFCQRTPRSRTPTGRVSDRRPGRPRPTCQP